MDPAFITPFIVSIQNVFSTMMQLPVTIGEPAIRTQPGTTYDVSGIIGMSGDVTGVIVLSFPKATATRVVALLAGSEMTPDNPDFPDAVGELTNMISGGAKGLFAGKKKVTISCPSVVMGPGHTVSRPRDVPCVVIPCSTDCGDLVLEIAIREVAAQDAAPARAA
ncbi:MAG: chemotaxis protein CheX, partial [Planctomyces sp.]|nr:chemotaxis protein CheX [Planctomyces sp.]